MPAPIILQDLSGLAEGITSFGKSIGEAAKYRGEQVLKTKKEEDEAEKQKNSMKAITNWAESYDSKKSPMQNIGSLQKALDNEGLDLTYIQPILKSVLSKSVSQEGEMFGANMVLDGQPPQPGSGQQSPVMPGGNNMAGIPGMVGQQTMDANPMDGEAPTSAMGVAPPSSGEVIQASVLQEDVPIPAPSQDRMQKFSDSDLVKMAGSPNRIVSNTAKAEIENRKLQQRVNKDERDWHTKFSIDQEKKVAALREAVPKKNAALTHARHAINSGETGIMTGTWLADITGIEALRGVEGAQLEVAAKEHFFGNMSRVSAKAQNIFFEKLLKGMFAQVGQTKETALAFTEMLQGELNMDEAFVKEFDKLSMEDESKFGFSRKDVERRARQAVEHMEELNLDRSLYRVQRLSEAQQSPKKIRENLSKPVAEGTPLTLEKKFLFMDKYKGDAPAAIRAIKKLGYKIPKASEVRLYMMPNKQFTEQMRGE